MNKSLWLIPIALMAIGCGSKAPETEASPQVSTTSPAPPGAGDISPTTTAPIPNAPVTGGTSLGEGGGGVAQSVKNKAKDTAANPGASSSLGNPTGNDDSPPDDGMDDQGH